MLGPAKDINLNMRAPFSAGDVLVVYCVFVSRFPYGPCSHEDQDAQPFGVSVVVVVKD